MTKPPEPNDMSHLSDEEFMALCPLGEHAPGPEPLSPAAQAVLDAWLTSENGERMLGDPACLAAALRAAADQVRPSQADRDTCPEFHSQVCFNGMDFAANELCNIAAELEGQQ